MARLVVEGTKLRKGRIRRLRGDHPAILVKKAFIRVARCAAWTPITFVSEGFH